MGVAALFGPIDSDEESDAEGDREEVAPSPVPLLRRTSSSTAIVLDEDVEASEEVKCT